MSLPTSDTLAIEQHLVKTTTDFVLACNSRHWNLQEYPWTEYSSRFKCGPTFATLPRDMDMPSFIVAFSTLYAELPGYYTHIASTTATVSERIGEAQVFANFENHGYTPGVVRYSVGFWEFRKEEDGRWRCIFFRSLPGPSGGTDEDEYA